MNKELRKSHPVIKSLVGLLLTAVLAVWIVQYQQNH